MDYHHNTISTVAARLFRSEHQLQLPKNRELDPYSDRYCRRPADLEPAWDDISLACTIFRAGALHMTPADP